MMNSIVIISLWTFSRIETTIEYSEGNDLMNMNAESISLKSGFTARTRLNRDCEIFPDER